MAKKNVVYTEWSQVDESLKMISEIDRRIVLEETSMNKDIDTIKERVNRIVNPLLQQKEMLEKNVQKFTEAKVDEFKDTKTKKFTFGAVGFRKSTEIVTRNVKAIIEALKQNKMTDCIITKESIDKEELGKYEDIALGKVGAKRKVGDKFYYEIYKERVDE